MSEVEYVDICDCDVNDIELLALFRNKRKNWYRLMYEGKESIYQQISHLLYNDAVFRMYNEARRISAENGTNTTGFNYPVTQLFDLGFFTSQVMAIRRLTDNHSDNPKRAVVSLPSILEDILNHLHLFTRENYICHDGTKYNYVEGTGIKKFLHEQLQENYDFLSSIEEADRNRLDKANEVVFKSIRKELNSVKDIRTFVNKYVAHMSDIAGKVNITPEQKGISLDRLDEAYKTIIKIGHFIGVRVLYGKAMPGIATPQFDKLEHLDKPPVEVKDLSALNEYWRARTKEVESWDVYGLKND